MDQDQKKPTNSNDTTDNRNSQPESSDQNNGDQTPSQEQGPSTSDKPDPEPETSQANNNPPTEAFNVKRTQSMPNSIRTEIIALKDEEDSTRKRKATSKFSLRFNSTVGNVTVRSSIRIRDAESTLNPPQTERSDNNGNEINAELTVLYSDNVSYSSSESLIAKDGMGYSLIRLGRTNATEEGTHGSNTATLNRPPPYHVATARDTASVQLTPAAAPPLVLYSAPPLQGAPPTYSALMRIGPREVNSANSQNFRLFSRRDIQIQPSAPFIAPQPPPSYAQAQGFCVSHPLQFTDAQDYVWGNEPVTLVCPYCNNFIVTTVHFRRSNLTHYSALALCICGCWPCCLLPYCMKSCKSAHHECPICSNVVGIYSPWQVT